jgi:hypothetical protein
VEAHINAASQLRATVAIVDVSEDPGIPRPQDLAWTEEVATQLMRRRGITTLINVLGDAVLVKLGAQRWSRSAAGSGFATYDCVAMDDGLALARKIALGQPV